MLSILVAYTKTKRVIGNRGVIPWNLPSERDRFKKITKNKYILMGRKSFEEIGHGLSYCTIIIISKTMTKAPEGCLLSPSLKQAIEIAKSKTKEKDSKKEEILIAGGGQIYKQALALPETKKIYATEIEKEFSGDTFFPELKGNWTHIIEENKIEGDVKYQYITYVKD